MRIEIDCVVLAAADVEELANFYQRLLGWPRADTGTDPSWARLSSPTSGAGIAVQHEPTHVRPRWPSARGHEQMQAHLDFRVSDAHQATRHAIECGAVLARSQFNAGLTVFLDPAGHPFCMFGDHSASAG